MVGHGKSWKIRIMNGRSIIAVSKQGKNEIKTSFSAVQCSYAACEIPLVSHIYQDEAAKSFNILPECVRNCIVSVL